MSGDDGPAGADDAGGHDGSRPADGDADDVEDADDADDAEGATDDPPVDEAAVLDELFDTIEARKRELPEGSYTASLFAHEKGQNAVLEKLGEETTEVLLAAKDDDTEELAHESADLVYHLLVLLAMHDLDLADLREELASRFAT